MAVSPTGDLLASGSTDGTVAIWNPGTGGLIRAVGDGSSIVRDLAFRPIGYLLAAAYGDEGAIALWDGVNLVVLDEHTERVRSIAFRPDGLMLATGSSDGTVVLWDETGAVARRLMCGGAVRSVVFSPDGSLLAVGTWNNSVELWDPATGTRLASIEHPMEVLDLAFSPDGTMLATSFSRTIRIYGE